MHVSLSEIQPKRLGIAPGKSRPRRAVVVQIVLDVNVRPSQVGLLCSQPDLHSIVIITPVGHWGTLIEQASHTRALHHLVNSVPCRLGLWTLDMLSCTSRWTGEPVRERQTQTWHINASAKLSLSGSAFLQATIRFAALHLVPGSFPAQNEGQGFASNSGARSTIVLPPSTGHGTRVFTVVGCSYCNQ